MVAHQTHDLKVAGSTPASANRIQEQARTPGAVIDSYPL